MIVSISQPTVFPWIGYFNIIKNSDVFVFLDNVKFEKRSWQMRNRVKAVTKDGESEVWIHIPTRIEKTFTLIKDVIIDNSQKWKEKHLKSFLANYGKSFGEIGFIKEIYNKEWTCLADFNIECITNCCKFLDIPTRLVRASNLSASGKKSELILNICKELGATEYLSTVLSKDYLENDKGMFGKENIKITYHDYKHPVYKQKGKIFIDHLSVLDLIFNEKGNAKNFV